MSPQVSNSLVAEPRLGKAIFILSLGAGCSFALAFVREILFAAKFGVSSEMDAYFTAFLIPQIFYNLIVAGIAHVAFIPVFKEYLAKGKEEEAWRAASTIVNVICIVSILLSLLMVVFAGQVIKIVAPGFNRNTHLLATKLLLLMFPMLVFTGISGILAAILNSYYHYLTPAFSMVVFNLAILFSLFTLVGKFGIEGIAYGVLGGAILQVLIQLPPLLKKRVRYYFIIDLQNPAVKGILVLYIPAMVGYVLGQGYALIEKMIASTLTTGSISALGFAFKILNLPLTIVGMAIGTAFFPLLSEYFSKSENDKFVDVLEKTLGNLFYVTLPISIVLIFMSKEIVSFIFQRKAFDINATLMTASALVCYSVGLFAICVNHFLFKAIVAMKKVKVTTLLTATAILFDLIFIYILVRPLGHSSIALAGSLSSIIITIIALFYLSKKVNLNIFAVGNRFFKIFTAACIAGAVLGISLRYIKLYPHATKITQMGLMFLLLLITGTVFLTCGYLLKIPEQQGMYYKIMQKVKALSRKTAKLK